MLQSMYNFTQALLYIIVQIIKLTTHNSQSGQMSKYEVCILNIH